MNEIKDHFTEENKSGIIYDMYGDPIDPNRSIIPTKKIRKKKETTHEDDFNKSLLYHKLGWPILQSLAPNYIGPVYKLAEGNWMKNRNMFMEIDATEGRLMVPLAPIFKTGCHGIGRYAPNGNALTTDSWELLPFMIRFHQMKGQTFKINCPRKGHLTDEEAPRGLAPFPKGLSQEDGLAIIGTLKKYVMGHFLLVHLVGPSIEEIQWIWLARFVNIPDRCFTFPNDPTKKNRIDLAGHREYTITTKTIIRSLSGEELREPEHSIKTALELPPGFKNPEYYYHLKQRRSIR